MQLQSKQEHTNNTRVLAGMSKNDNNIEIIRSQNRTCVFVQNGKTKPFSKLPSDIYKKLEELFLSDQEAVNWITGNYKSESDNLIRLTEIYTSFYFGQFDFTPDVINGNLQPPENFRESPNCPSIGFNNTYIDIEGVHLAPRDLSIIDNMIAGMTDKLIASQLGIAQSTYDFHKRNLFKKLNIQSKQELIVKSFKSKVAI